MIKEFYLNEITENITDGKHGDCTNLDNSGFYFVSVKDIGKHGINYQNSRQITEADFIETNKRTKLEIGDTIVANSGHTIGKMLFIDEHPYVEKTTFQKSVAIIKPMKDKILDRFLFYVLQSNIERLRQAAVGSAQKNLLLEDMRKFKLKFFEDKQYQKKIVDILLPIDEKIRINNRINTELESMAKSLYDYWFVQFDFPDKNGLPYKESGGKLVWNKEMKREVPEDWEVMKLCELGEFKNGINYDPSLIGDTEAKIINVRNISSSSWFVSQYELDTIVLKGKDVANYLITDKDILIARSGIPGATRMMYEYEENTIYCGFIIRYQVSDLKNKNYLFFSLKDLERSTTSKSGGTIMQNVNQDTLKRMLLILPNKEMISAFNDFITPIFQRINNNIKETQTLTSLRDWLLPMLMNGQVKVK